MDALCVVVAPQGPADGVLDVLQDYSALGLVAPFLWVDSSNVTSVRVLAREVRDGRQVGTTVEDALTRGRWARIRVCVLVPMLPGASVVPTEVEQQIAELVQSTSGGAQVDRLRCVVTRPGQDHGAGDLAREGWHNLLVAPEDSRGPGSGHSVLPPSTDPVGIGQHAAPVVASLLGLWTDIEGGPLDHEPVLPGRTVRLARSFYRRLDARAVEAQLRAELFATAQGSPLPREHGQSAVYIDDVPLATGTMASELWTKHASVLQGHRVRPAQQHAKPIGPLAALRMMFGFLAAALRNAPAQWYATVCNRVSSGVARRVHGAVFGAAPAEYAVVVNGLTGDGLPATWAELAEAGSRVETALTDPGEQRSHEATAGLGAVWRDYAIGALTLVDAGVRDPMLPPVQVGAARGVLRRVADSVPGAGEDFTGLPGYVAASVGFTRVAPTDVLGAHALAQRLDHLAHDPAAALEAGRARQSLGEWQLNRQQSYGAQVGGILGKRLLDVSAEVRHLVAALAEAARAQEPDVGIRGRQRRLARLMRTILLVLVIAIAGTVVLGALALIAWSAVAFLVLGATIAWFITSFVVFLRQQRALFRELNRRRAAIDQAEAMAVNLRQALKDQRRLASAYRQFLAWSGVLGAFLAAPFGTPSTTGGALPALRGGLPLGVRLGEAAIDDEELADVVAQLRREVFTTGWLSAPFEATVNAVGHRLGPDAYDLRENPGLIFEIAGGPEETPLTRWMTLLRTEGTAASSTDDKWARLLDALAGTRAEIGNRLVGTVRPTDASGRFDVALEEFMAGVDRTDQEAPRQRFASVVLAGSARMRVSTEVELTRGRAVRTDLGRVATITQFGAGLPDYEFLAGQGDTGWSEPEPHRPEPPPQPLAPRSAATPPPGGDGAQRPVRDLVNGASGTITTSKDGVVF